MTTLVQVEDARGRRRRCDATCHNARSEAGSCICAGRFRGLQDPGPDLRAAYNQHAGEFLLALGRREAAGEFRIVMWRETFDGPLVRRRDLRRRPWQLPLWPSVPAPALGAQRSHG